MSRFSADVATLRLHPALLDMATGAALYLTKDYDSTDDLFLPITYKRMRVYRTLARTHVQPHPHPPAKSAQ